jgi:tetratricopeptide (TPR) repeat protein
MTQARTAYTCADNADHDGLRVWTRGLQSLIAYWSGRLADSVKNAQRGADAASRSRGTSAVWLAASEARGLAALGRLDEAHDAVDRAAQARERARDDEVDELGGICTFTRPRQLYYAADALAWAGAEEVGHTEALAAEALDAYATAPEIDRAFGDEAGTRCALAVACIARGEIEGAAEAVAPVLDLPPAQRIHGIVTSVEHVHRALAGIESGRSGSDLAEQLHAFAIERLALTR